jgi:hypothetical protein
MELNIFAGARRIAWFVAVPVVAFLLFEAESSTPFLSMSYDLHNTGPKIRFERAYRDDCGEGMDYFNVKSKSGHSVRIDLCPPTGMFRYTIGKGLKKITSWTGDKDYDTREKFIYANKSAFHFSPEDEEFIEDEATRYKFEKRQDNMKVICVFLSIFFGIVSGIGWVVRGFLEIPTGMDRKPEKISFKNFNLD